MSLVMPDLESSDTRQPDVEKQQQVKLAAEMAIKEIRLYGFEVLYCPVCVNPVCVRRPSTTVHRVFLF